MSTVTDICAKGFTVANAGSQSARPATESRDKLRAVASDVPVLTPLLTAREPAMISDGGGLPFPPLAPFTPFVPLDPSAPPVGALLDQIDFGRRQSNKTGLFHRSGRLPKIPAEQKLTGWRALAATEDEVLYAKGRPPQLLTVKVTRGRRDKWLVIGVSNSRPLRASRQGIRASSWRLDPDFEVSPEQSELHLLVTEQTQATGVLAADRMLAPDLYLGEEELILRLYVTALEGYTGRTRRYETAVTIRLPEPVGERALVDGAIYEPPGAPGEAPEVGSDAPHVGPEPSSE
jgi:hypothetical protein